MARGLNILVTSKFKYLIGIDEAGRGPLAGPVAVGAVVIKGPISKFKFQISKKGIKDSKKLTPRQRERIFGEMKKLKKLGKLNFAVSLVGNKIIDDQGIVPAIKLGVARCLRKLNEHSVLIKNCLVLLDGGLKAPEEYQNQKTIIKGDEKELVIALASIAAKVTRDRYMINLAKNYPKYNFAQHKGYGTKAHYRAIKKNGLSEVHRRSFLTQPPRFQHPSLAKEGKGEV